MSFAVTAIVGGGAIAAGVSLGTAAAIGIGAAAAYNMNEQQKKANQLQEQAQNQAVKQAQQQATAVENQAQVEAANRVKNTKTANAADVLSRQQGIAGGAGAGTMLTGPQGIDMSSLALSKNTLLGM